MTYTAIKSDNFLSGLNGTQKILAYIAYFFLLS